MYIPHPRQGGLQQRRKMGRKVVLLESSFQVFLILLLLHCLESLLRHLVLVGEGISVHDTHIMSTVHHSLS